MNFEFIYNEYILIWNLLFRQSISKEINDSKQKIWINYKKEYNALFYDKDNILSDPKNYIPKDDTIYNIVKELNFYPEIEKKVEKFRLTLIREWDKVRKPFNKYLKELLRIDLNNYKVYVIDSRLEVTDIVDLKDKKVIIYASSLTNEYLIENLVYKIVHSEIKISNHDDIVNACLELVLRNEVPTRITGKSHYLDGRKTLQALKKQIYPYFLMYMGVKKEDFIFYMRRDGIIFDESSFAYNDKLKDMNIFSFIDFCIKNVEYAIKVEDLEIL